MTMEVYCLMLLMVKKRTLIRFSLVLLLTLTVIMGGHLGFSHFNNEDAIGTNEKGKDYIKWVDFNVPSEAMKKALKLDIESQGEEVKLDWIEMLSYLAAKNGNNFKSYKDKQLDEIADKLREGKTMEELTKDMKYYPYYFEAFNAVLSGFAGSYEIQVPNEDGRGNHWEKRYGLKAFSPIAKNYYYNHYDDFGQSRSYGFSRNHLGNDLMGQVGTPIIAVEGVPLKLWDGINMEDGVSVYVLWTKNDITTMHI
ncbi:hypothetical protein [Aminipila terrae]|uniref:hypothetical protein n=1 Tax=Aminipila terrae TaxID=2697030 RepID=UPI002ED076E8